MTITEIIALANAGFSKEEISKIAVMQQPAPAQTMPMQQPAPVQTMPMQQPAPAQTMQTPPTDFNAWGQQFLAGLDSTLQKHNLAQAQQATETVDDILANIIAPPGKKEVK